MIILASVHETIYIDIYLPSYSYPSPQAPPLISFQLADRFKDLKRFAFIGCHGRWAPINGGWWVIKPSCKVGVTPTTITNSITTTQSPPPITTTITLTPQSLLFISLPSPAIKRGIDCLNITYVLTLCYLISLANAPSIQVRSVSSTDAAIVYWTSTPPYLTSMPSPPPMCFDRRTKSSSRFSLQDHFLHKMDGDMQGRWEACSVWVRRNVVLCQVDCLCLLSCTVPYNIRVSVHM